MSRYDEDMCEAISIGMLNIQQDSSNSFICCKLIAQTKPAQELTFFAYEANNCQPCTLLGSKQGGNGHPKGDPNAEIIYNKAELLIRPY